MFLGLRVADWLSVLAIVSSPLIALEVQRRLDRRRQKRERQLAIFRALMTTRASRMAPQHIDALNSIEVEFYSPKGTEKKVLDAWREYCNHLYIPDELAGDDLKRWGEKQDDLFVDLVHRMASCLGYDIDKVTIRRNAYYPKGYGEIESEQHALRKAALDVFSGTRPMRMSIVGPVAIDETAYVVSQPDNSDITTVIRAMPMQSEPVK